MPKTGQLHLSDYVTYLTSRASRYSHYCISSASIAIPLIILVYTLWSLRINFLSIILQLKDEGASEEIIESMQDTVQGIAEMEIFDLGIIYYAKYQISEGLSKPPYYFNLILWNIAYAQADILNLELMIKELPEGSICSVGSEGNSQIEMNAMFLIVGGGLRVGLEDNIWFDENRIKLATNLYIIEGILFIIKALGKTPYSQKEAREILGV